MSFILIVPNIIELTDFEHISIHRTIKNTDENKEEKETRKNKKLKK